MEAEVLQFELHEHFKFMLFFGFKVTTEPFIKVTVLHKHAIN